MKITFAIAMAFAALVAANPLSEGTSALRREFTDVFSFFNLASPDTPDEHLDTQVEASMKMLESD